jgi:hypothetical protein
MRGSAVVVLILVARVAVFEVVAVVTTDTVVE